MRTLVIGDIHGCFTALTTLEQKMAFTADDLVITLGDYVDRGPKSREVLEWLLARARSGQLVALMGNHELMMQWARKDPVAEKSWMTPHIGGTETLESYGKTPGRLADVPDSHWTLIAEGLKRYHETEQFIFVHGGLKPGVAVEDQKDEALMWAGFGPQGLHVSGKPVICGHTEQRNGTPSMLAHGICLDTGAYKPEGWLTCLDIDTGEYGQANEKGEFRTGSLPVKPAALGNYGPSGTKS